MKRMTYLCRIGRNSLGLPRQAKADMSIKTAQLPALCLLNQYGIKKLSTVSDNKSKKCLVKSGKDKFFTPQSFSFPLDSFYGVPESFYFLRKSFYSTVLNIYSAVLNIYSKVLNMYSKVLNKIF